MKARRTGARLALALTGTFIASLAAAAPGMAAEVETVYGLTTSDKLVTFSSERPGTTSAPLTLTGLAAGDDVESIDFRPATGELFALIRNGTNGQVASIDVATGAVTKLGAATFALDGDDFGFDFNPNVDRIRIHADSNDNLRINPNNGALVDGDPGTAGVQQDPDLVFDNGVGDPNVTASGYTSSFPGTNRTQLYGIDTGIDMVVEFDAPNPTFEQVSRVSPLNAGGDVTDASELDITARGRALAILRVGTAAPKLHQIDINANTNSARDIGTIGPTGAMGVAGPDPVEELAIAPRLRTFVALTDGAPQQLIRFRSDRPEAASAPVNVSGLPMSTTLVGIDTRNENGVVYGLGSDSRLYTLDIDTGAATVVGTGPFMPLLAGTAFGVDFNPVPDRLRVTSDQEQNLRINPDTGLGAVGAAGTNQANDAPLNPAGNVVGSAYTNPKADAQDTQLFALDSGDDQLKLQSPPNDGTLAPVGGSAATAALGVDASSNVGYDIVPEFNQGFAAIDVQGGTAESNLYSVGSVANSAAGPVPGSAVLIGRINAPAGRVVTGLAFLKDDVLTVGSPTAAVAEGGAATVTVLRSGPAEAAVSATVNLTPATATAGADYGAVTPATVSLAAGETVKTVSIPTVNDTADEPAEVFVASLASPTNGAGIGKPGATAVVITDDDPTPTGPQYPPPPAADRTPPVITLGVADRIRTGDLRRGIRVRVGVSEAARIVGNLKFRGRTFARFTRTRTSGGVTTVRLRLSRSERRTLNRRARSALTLGVSATDPAGNRGLARDRITVTRR